MLMLSLLITPPPPFLLQHVQQTLPDEEAACFCSGIQETNHSVRQGCHSDGGSFQIQGRLNSVWISHNP